ncbi:hypothetical protein [Commensalibacter oyaizuii]|uniref:Uncharacterized protein n=1 Tax=Commensalibacter oyaizuii TaxID=3043873 RepID=A0ABT6Q192_9PROT|nr:hypothetical protein [Commensalibacter sp. TBRC 16381]MDI2090875.1 hypothetical protein [Commensalibacter sp. TBRC 16381]
MNLSDDPSLVDGKIGYGLVTTTGSYHFGNGYEYIVTGGFNPDRNAPVTQFLNQPVTLSSGMSSGQNVKVLAGGTAQTTYIAGQESGQFVGGNQAGNNIVFRGNTVNGGDWVINTGRANSTIELGNGNNNVISEGHDTITAAVKNGAGRDTVALFGNNSFVDVGAGSLVNDVSYGNTITVGGGSTVNGGTSGTVTFDGSYDSNVSSLNGGFATTVKATGDLNAAQIQDGQVDADKNFTLFNGGGDISATVAGNAIGFGSRGLNYTLNAEGDQSGFFTADAGNETLNASGSTAGLNIFANTIVGGGNTTFNATGGSGNDTFTAGTGNSTFTGGEGNNAFLFADGTSDGGTTVITDFAKDGSTNGIGLFNYGLNQQSLAELLRNSQNDANGNAVLNIEGKHTIIIEGVSVSELTTDKFLVS